jgi:DNA-binding transcriptional ArsR family regulator
MAKRRFPRPAPDEVDPRIVKAMSHPLRFRLLGRLNAGVASPSEMARELGLPVGRVSHHVRTLAKIGAIELVRQEPRRGATEHYYRAVVPAWFSDEDWARLPGSVRSAIGDQVVRDVLMTISAAAPQGFDHPKAHLSFLPVGLDARGMDEMADLLRRTLEEAQAIEARSSERDAGERTTGEVVIMLFERTGD